MRFNSRYRQNFAIAASVGQLLLVNFVECASAAGPDELYEARTIVTGRTEENRAEGFARALEAVLVKPPGIRGWPETRRSQQWRETPAHS